MNLSRASLLAICLLTMPTAMAQVSSTIKPPEAGDQHALWDAVEQGNTVADYETYLSQYPDGIYAKLARARKAALEEKARKSAAEEDTQWQLAERGGKKSDFEAFLRRYPVGRLADRAKEKLALLDRATEQQKPGSKFSDCPKCPEMMTLPGGSFEMGANDGDNAEKPVHRVTVASFAIGVTEVTQTQWREIVGNNPAYFNGCDNCPVELVNWDDAQDFIRKLNARTGRQYRLPSEAEWEYACRAGRNDRFCGGNAIELLGRYSGNSGSFYVKKTWTVAGKQANAWGLYDMSGNVAEWVQDCWNDNYQGAPADGSAWTTGDCGRRLIRGGSWVNGERYARASDRYGNDFDDRNKFIGFRVALSVKPK